MNQEVATTDKFMQDLQNTQKMCAALMQTPHYRKMGPEGIFAIVEKAKSLGLNPMEALNGGLYYVKGKVEMTSATMGKLIRSKNHSYTRARESDDTICILHGRRCDTGDTWTESFSIEDAKRAGIYTNAWKTYPRDMLYARALSRLARQLFPDVISGCYVSGEISEAPALIENVDIITEEEANELLEMLEGDEKFHTCVLNTLEQKCKTRDIFQMPRESYNKLYPVAKKKYEERQEPKVEEAVA